MAVTSPLKAFTAMRQQAVAGNVIRYRVPLYVGRDPEIFVEFDPLAHADSRGLSTRIEKAKDKAAAEVDGTIALLVKACRRVYMRGADGEEIPLREDPSAGDVRFDRALAQALGLDPDNTKAADVVRALYVREPDIIACGGYLTKESGYRDVAADEALRGE